MPHSLPKSGAVVLASWMTLFGTAHAELIVVRSGGLGFDTGDPPTYVFRGEGFEILALFPSLAGPFPLPCTSAPCVPGSVVSLGTQWGGPLRAFNLGSGTATIGDVPSGGPGPGGGLLFRGAFSFDTPAVSVPDSDDLAFTLFVPFLFSGRLAGFVAPAATAPLFEVDLRGEGRARLRLSRGDNPSGPFFFSALRYDFADPVPEPGALLLVGSGLAGLWVRRRRSNSGQ